LTARAILIRARLTVSIPALYYCLSQNWPGNWKSTGKKLDFVRTFTSSATVTPMLCILCDCAV